MFANGYFFVFVLLGAEILIIDVMDQMPGIPALLTKLVNRNQGITLSREPHLTLKSLFLWFSI